MTTKTKTIHGLPFEITVPYAEGHTLTAAEAKVLNQTRSENIGNNLRTQIKDAVEAGDTAGLQAIVTKYDNEYIFTMANASASRKLDPTEREARAIARDWVKAKLAETGRKVSTAPEGHTEESWAEYIDGKIDEVAANPAVLKEAQKRVAAKAKFAVAEVEL